MCTVVAVKIMMITVRLMNNEGHSDYVSDGTDDNDKFLSALISSLPLVIKTFYLHQGVIPR